MRKLAEIGAYGVNFHDNDVFDFGLMTASGTSSSPRSGGPSPRVDAEELGARGMAFEQLDQLALEHLYGVR